MEVFRTIGVVEFFRLLLGEKIVGKTQSSCYCYEMTNKKEIISMNVLHKSCCCGFLEPLFFDGRDNEKILLKLDIPMENITYGCGDYFSPLYNNYIDGEDCIIHSTYGLDRFFKGMIKTRIKEVHFDEYDISNVVGVYFPYFIKYSTELGYTIQENNKPFEFGEFLYGYFKRVEKMCRKNHSIKFVPKFKDLDCLPFDMSINLAKKILKDELLNNKSLSDCNLPVEDILRVVDTFKYFSNFDLSAKLDKPNTLSYISRDLDVDEVVGLLYELSTNSYFSLSIKDLPECDMDNKQFLDFFRNVLFLAKDDTSSRLFLEKNEQKIKNLLYAMYVDVI